VVEGVKGM